MRSAKYYGDACSTAQTPIPVRTPCSSSKDKVLTCQGHRNVIRLLHIAQRLVFAPLVNHTITGGPVGIGTSPLGVRRGAKKEGE